MYMLKVFEEENVLVEAIKELKGSVSSIQKAIIKKTIISHPNYPSLLSLSDTFTDWKIDNLPIQLDEKEINQIYEFPIPFLAHIKINQEEEEFVLVTELNKNGINYLSSKGRKQSSFQDFKGKWTRIALLLSSNENITIKESPKDKNKRKWTLVFETLLIGLFFTLISVGLLNILQIGGGFFLGLGLLKIMGLSISSILLMRELGASKELVKTICKMGNSDCDIVLDKKKMKLFGVLSWAELGVIYFSFGLFFMSLANNLSDVLWILAILNILTLVFIPYSLYYQKEVAKAWCLFCLITLVLFASEGMLLYFLNDWNFNFSLNIISSMSISVLFPVVVIFLFKPFYTEVNQLKNQNKTLNRFKYNIKNFNQILKSEPKKEISNHISPVVLGNMEADNELVVVTNPYCGPCKTAHNYIDYYLERPNMFENIKFTILFVVGSDKSSKKYKVAQKTIQAFLENSEKGNRVINQWYQDKDFEEWMKNFEFDEKYIDLADDFLEKHQGWAIQNQVNFTPTVFFNGYELPQEFTIQDLKFFL